MALKNKKAKRGKLGTARIVSVSFSTLKFIASDAARLAIIGGALVIALALAYVYAWLPLQVQIVTTGGEDLELRTDLLSSIESNRVNRFKKTPTDYTKFQRVFEQPQQQAP